MNEWCLCCADLVLEVTPTSLIVGEDGSASGNIEVTKRGYSFGEVSFSLVSLTYSEYISEVRNNLDTLFPLRPYTPASSETSLPSLLCSPHFKYSIPTSSVFVKIIFTIF